jgi:hypothetical protein
LNLSSNDPELLSSVERRGARVDEIDDLVDGLPVSKRVARHAWSARRALAAAPVITRCAQFKVNDKGRLVVLEGNLQLLEKADWQERRLFVFTGVRSRVSLWKPNRKTARISHYWLLWCYRRERLSHLGEIQEKEEVRLGVLRTHYVWLVHSQRQRRERCVVCVRSAPGGGVKLRACRYRAKQVRNQEA